MNAAHPFRILLACLFAAAIAGAAPAVHAQVGDAWKHKVRLVLDTTDAGAAIKSAQPQFVLPIRLHTGNFDFSHARPDGADLRVVAADGKTVLPHRLEFYDSANELAVLWVRVPTLAPSNNEPSIWLYSGNPAAEALTPPVLRDGTTLAILHAVNTPANETADGVDITPAGAEAEPQGLLGQAVKVGASGSVRVAGSSSALGPDGTTVSMWVRIAPGATGPLLSVKGAQSSVELGLAAGVLQLKVQGTGAPAGAGAAANASAALGADWTHVALVAGERVALFVNGTEVAAVSAKLPAQPAQFTVGGGTAASIDALTVSKVARPPEWIRATMAAQGPDNKLVGLAAEAAEGGEANHFKILVDNLTLDGKVVIYILLVMFVIAFWVIVSKSIMLNRIARANAAFREAFEQASADALEHPDFGAASVGAAGSASRYETSTLYRMFRTASMELKRRRAAPDADGTVPLLNPKATASIRSAVDATAVRETTRLNKLMVLLTIAISGGPFIGLLGTVVGVMITFAAIAAAGDVNINSIAPGIAAALLATVAGLAVAIPALFAYNWLASKIKEISTEMQIFADELASRVAERYEV